MKNKSLNIFRSLCLGFLIAMGSCASEDLTVEYSSEGSEGSKAIVNFSIDNQSAFFGEPGSASRAAATELQTATEKKITTLTAVVFKTTTTAGSKENDADKFLMAKDITTVPQNNGTFSFSLGEEGNLWVCFVANAGTTLNNQIKGLKGKTVKDFKALVSEEDPDGNDKLMVSGFHNIQASFTKPATIALVTLTRNMARIDIENASDGITITKILFHNRSVKSKLINDNSVTFDASMLPASPATPKSYDANLVGDSKNPTSLKSKIYSYEQFAGIDKNKETERPYLEVHYTVSGESPSKTYKHNIYFEDNKKGPKTATAVQLKRNTLYTVTVKNSKSNITFSISVSDWLTGKTFQVTTDQLIHGATTGPDYSNVAVGDFMLKDGTIVKPDAVSSHKADVIGVVFSIDESRIGAEAKKKLGGKAHGLVMALKNASTGTLAWKNENTTSNRPQIQTMEQCYNDFNGYDNTQKIITDGGSSLSTKYPAFNAVNEYEKTVKAPQGTTGWYLPAIGEWYDIVEKLGNVTIKDEFKTGSATGDQILKDQQGTQINSITTADNINTHLKKIGGSYVDEFDVTSSQSRLYWSSSEYNENNARSMLFSNNGNLYVHYHYKTYTYYVRCVLAF